MSSLMEKSPLGVFQAHWKKGELAYQVCLDDNKPVFYPRAVAPETGSDNLEWRVSKGLGTVYSTTVVHYKGEPPLNVALIDIDEGFRMMSRVEDIDPMQVKIGMRVKFAMHPGRREAAALSRVHARGGREMSGLQTRQRRGRRRGRIRSGPGRAEHEPARPDGAGDACARSTMRPQALRRRRLVRRRDAGAHGADGARRISAHQAEIFRRHDHRRLVVHDARRARAGRDRARPVRSRGDRLRQHAALGVAAPPPRRASTIHYESPYRPILPISAYAMAAARHMHQFGTTREQLAEVAVAGAQMGADESRKRGRKSR